MARTDDAQLVDIDIPDALNVTKERAFADALLNVPDLDRIVQAGTDDDRSRVARKVEVGERRRVRGEIGRAHV